MRAAASATNERINADTVARAISGFRLLPFFPNDEQSKVWIADLLTRMCRYEHEVTWLVREVADTWNRWEGTRTLRSLFCSRFRPHDGIDPRYADDNGRPIPLPAPLCAADRAKVLSQGKAPAALPPPQSRITSTDSELQQSIASLAEQKRMR